MVPLNITTATVSGDDVVIFGLYEGYYTGVVLRNGKHMLYFWNLYGQTMAKNLKRPRGASNYGATDLSIPSKLRQQLAEALNVHLGSVLGRERYEG